MEADELPAALVNTEPPGVGINETTGFHVIHHIGGSLEQCNIKTIQLHGCSRNLLLNGVGDQCKGNLESAPSL